jgi:anti-sigma regulatory factor (Ser/Thr protein kinase)
MTARKQAADARIELVLDRSGEDQAGLLAGIDAFAAARSLPETLRYRLGLIIDELVTNCIVHGACLGQGGGVRVTVEDREEDLLVEIVDSGETFDPTAATLPQCPQTGQVPLGGVGLSLVRRFADWAHYSRSNNHNHLRLSLNKNRKKSDAP